MIDGPDSGKLYGAPPERTGQNSKTFAIARGSVVTSESLFVSVIAFADGMKSALFTPNDGNSEGVADPVYGGGTAGGGLADMNDDL